MAIFRLIIHDAGDGRSSTYGFFEGDPEDVLEFYRLKCPREATWTNPEVHEVSPVPVTKEKIEALRTAIEAKKAADEAYESAIS